jgi:hypothetical protein
MRLLLGGVVGRSLAPVSRSIEIEKPRYPAAGQRSSGGFLRLGRGSQQVGRQIVYLVATVTALVLWGDSPALAVSSWESRQVDVGTRESDSLSGVSCPTTSFCVAVGSRGTIVTSENPHAGAAAWRSETLQPGAYAGTVAGEPDRTSPGTLEGISCPATEMCAAVTYAGDLYASGNPKGGASTWRAVDLDGEGADTHLKGVSCPTSTFCVAAAASSGTVGSNGGGKIVVVRDPLSALTSVAQVQLDESLELQAVSCASLAFCMAVANKGRIVVSNNPASVAPAWREIGTPGGPGDLRAVHCPSSSLCLAGNARGNVLSSTDANFGASSWRVVNTGPSVPITGISCPTVSRCAAVDNNGDIAVSINPTGPLGSWSATNLIPFSPSGSQGLPLNAFFGVSCPSIDLCAAVGSRGLIFTNRDPFYIEESRSDKKRGGPKRPRMKIVRSDKFAKQSHTKGVGSRVTFRLRPYGRARGFVCKLDRRKFRRCKSPLRIYAKVGSHVLRARAIGVTGLKGPLAKHRFAIRGPRSTQSRSSDLPR